MSGLALSQAGAEHSSGPLSHRVFIGRQLVGMEPDQFSKPSDGGVAWRHSVNNQQAVTRS